MQEKPVMLQVPIHGCFICPNTPGSRIPSHGIDMYGVKYAIDFVIVNENARSQKPYRSSFFVYLIKGLPLSDFYGYGIDIHSPVNGIVEQVVDGMEDRNPVNILKDLKDSARITREFTNNQVDAKYLLGNHIIIKTKESKYVVLAHLQKNSIIVKPGSGVDTSMVIGKLGNSGNSMMPHVHLQAMDDIDFLKTKGLPITFAQYYLIKNGRKTLIHDSVPEENQKYLF